MQKLFENWRRYLNEETKDTYGSEVPNMYKASLKKGVQAISEEKEEVSVDSWKHDDAKSYAKELIEKYGMPDASTDDMVLWEDGKISEFKKVYVLDESIPHESPKPHHDFVYSTMEIDIPEDKLESIAKASESIIVDQLKNEVTARCGDIIANAITLGFVQKIVNGEIKPESSVEEYKKHILQSKTPEWFKEK